ncbi:hypothetical protein A3D88_01850 [Candidatus Peribacteria bacterium RIFCSPHIGHO2_02_FULL_52_16]|nr:MAG: hypothetical protein A2706_05045 [Candidatus Peribacteria bacterium RIFCSPHIGHO2_01_FULL_51_35]OGJ61131.1 MAG: hypothetical protein A3D88_01850 [Candidatus Peribacteria bacterium RIFCSPHIGHO2_02_FULL_52_16]
MAPDASEQGLIERLSRDGLFEEGKALGFPVHTYKDVYQRTIAYLDLGDGEYSDFYGVGDDIAAAMQDLRSKVKAAILSF